VLSEKPLDKRVWCTLLLTIALLASVLTACADQELLPANPYAVSTVEKVPLDEFLAAAGNDHFLTRPSFAPTDARYFEEINRTFAFTPDELALLEQNGFLVSDRLAFADFTTAYAYIYWKDLPVLVTTDSILYVVHHVYDELLARLESTVLTSKLSRLLTESLRRLQRDAEANDDARLNALYADLEVYLSIPLALLTGRPEPGKDAPQMDRYLELAETADDIAEIELFGGQRKIDFTLFKHRGHYIESEELKRYFRAISWLTHVDFRFVEYDPQGQPKLNVEHLAAAAILRQAIDEADQRRTWQEFDALFGAFVGRSDNMRLPDLDRFLKDAKAKTPAILIHRSDPDELLALLTTRDYGQQRITGQILSVHAGNPNPLPRPVNFALLGQRFAIDSYLMSNLVYDQLLVDGQKVQRPLPSPLDVMYVLGNDRATTHLQDELAQYGYQGNLAALRRAVDDYDPAFWTGTVYNRWLGALRELNRDTTEAYPQAMRTAAWADKMLHTQLASWAQLRHDNVLYAKQSVTSILLCDYPAGYVEPYPEFYAAIRDYARAGRALFESLSVNEFTPEEPALREAALTHFANLETVAGRLQSMAEKELRREPFTPEEEAFLQDTAVRHLETQDTGCAEVTLEHWEGWYASLFLSREASLVLIADIHTNPNNDPNFPALYPPTVLHVATGPVAGIVFVANTDEGPIMYVGPTFTYYEVVEEGYPPVRLTDQTWLKRLGVSPLPAVPDWTGAFRLPASAPFSYLSLPGKPSHE
jgi:hypothetical protein